MDFSFFTENNKSGYKTRETWLSKNHPDIYSKIIEYSSTLDINISFKEKILFFFQKKTERPKCVTCGSELKFRERFDKPYGEFCSLDCINNNKTEMVNRQVNTFQKKYGVDFYPQHNEFVSKQKNTKKIKYGDENYNNTLKTKETKKQKYGDEDFNNLEKYKITCQSKYGVSNYSKSNSYKNLIKTNYKKIYPDINFIDIKKTFVDIKCEKCDTIFEISKQLFYERYKRNHQICLTCNPLGQSQRSNHEVELSLFLTSLNVNHELNNRNLIGKELDLFIPNKKLAIEINGLYWHNELFLESDYHLKKTELCNSKDVSLMHIFEDEWIYKKNIVYSIIKNKLNISDKKYYARQCVVKEVSSKETSVFLDENHIQGNVKSKIRLGLYYNNKLISLMTFSKGRLIMGGKKDEWELTRFCNLIDTNVIGGASKLFNFFLKKYKPNKIISYSDIRLFDGKLYEKLGFERKSQSVPNYWYVINSKRFYRFNFTKSKLVSEGFDKNKTEKQIMFERKFYRIYDCGNIRWEFHLQ